MTLPRPLAQRLRSRARSSARPVSALVREALEAYLGEAEVLPLPSFTGIGASGHADTSEKAEELIRSRLRRKTPS